MKSEALFGGMERGVSPGRWAHRVFVKPPQEDRRQGNKWLELERDRRQLSNSNASPPSVATTKTHERTTDQISFTHGRHQNSSTRNDGKSPRLQPKPPSSPSSRLSCSTSITPRPTATRDISHKGSDDISQHKSSRDTLTKLQSPHSTVISEHANEFVNHGQHEQTSVIARLSRTSLHAADSHRSRRRVRRKSIDSRSFLSDDTNSVSSGYGSLPACPEENLKCSPQKSQNGKHGQNESKPLLLRRRSSSFSVSTGEISSRAEYLKAFNESIRLRNAKKISLRQRPATANSNLPDIATSKSAHWRRLRLLVQSAPVRGRRPKMDSGTNDSWEDFVALGMPVDDLIDLEKTETMTPRSIQNITSSREHERVLSEFNGDHIYRKDGAFKKSMTVIAGGMKSMNMSNVGKSPRSSPRTPDVDALIEEDESEGVIDDMDVHRDDGKSSTKIRSRGWKIVKARLSEIAEKAPKNGIDSTPLTFRNIAQLVKAKQFRMMLKRRASFMDNGRFQFEEAKQDLYARYKLDPLLISKLTHTPRDSQGSHNGGGAKK